MKKKEKHYDYIIIGSGFGGSVSAMRLTQKGYSVLVIEAGKRWQADTFADRNWNLRKFLWVPLIGCYGIQRINLFRDTLILSGAGVGGGSLNYANTLYVPPDVFFSHPSVKRLGGKKGIMPYYKLAQKMLGVVTNRVTTPQDELLRETAKEIGREKTYRMTPVGVYFGKKGEKSKDPYFAGEGPERIGCELCGKCMTGCKKDAKNTLDKNYLYFAEKFGAEILPEHQVIDIEPLSSDGSQGYRIRTKKVTGFFGRLKGKTFTSSGVVLSAGALGTNSLLLKMKDRGRLPGLSHHLGQVVRTNSEVLLGARSKSKDDDFSKGIAITSSIHINENTHIEPVRYADGDDAMGLLNILLTDGGGKIPRWLRYILNALRHPLDALTLANPVGFARKSIILLVMQTHDNHLTFVLRPRLMLPFIKTVTSKQSGSKKNPVYIPEANDFARRLARRIKGIPANALTEVLLNAPMTAHIMGGCSVAALPEDDVIDEQNRVKGYANMIVADGSQIPENLGVNPALSITALTERAMSFIPPKNKKVHYLKAEKKWKMDHLLVRTVKNKPRK